MFTAQWRLWLREVSVSSVKPWWLHELSCQFQVKLCKAWSFRSSRIIQLSLTTTSFQTQTWRRWKCSTLGFPCSYIHHLHEACALRCSWGGQDQNLFDICTHEFNANRSQDSATKINRGYLKYLLLHFSSLACRLGWKHGELDYDAATQHCCQCVQVAICATAAQEKSPVAW